MKELCSIGFFLIRKAFVKTPSRITDNKYRVSQKKRVRTCVSISHKVFLVHLQMYIIIIYYSQILYKEVVTNPSSIGCTFFKIWSRTYTLLQSAFGTVWSESVLPLVEGLNSRSTLRVVPCCTTTQRTVICARLVSVDS